ncbi:glucosaminidase domain-containing protein [Marinimicrobium alkaliphilum]|uniref:glucosaminidase domain-containing protein n=1 Tax=Marinimicrobium alkaliphilum TaxID=2202654 RepID=UPI000DBA46DC|nr:glucosaminidase domain-containing protein [Marinimicrobium alkaliphilum]
MQHTLFRTLPGLAFIAYALACLALAWWLIAHPPVQEEAELVTIPRTPELRPSQTQLPDMGAISHIPERKQAFIDLLLPMIDERNQYIRSLRVELSAMHTQVEMGMPLSRRQKQRLEQLRIRYRLSQEREPDTQVALERLLRRADEIPPSMVLAQAAAESGWGTSRFAREANNIFGQWCFTEGCGLVPGRRPEGARHEVQLFDSVEAAVQSYYRNINTHRAYQAFRNQRAEQRANGDVLDGHALVSTLLHYSSRGQDYVDELQHLIRFNNFDAYDWRVTAAR